MTTSTFSETRGPNTRSAKSLFAIAIWFGVVTGVVEGASLVFFQRVNWAQWGRMMHVSRQILWISPLVDMIFFTILALAVWTVALLLPRVQVVRILAFVLIFLATYDWLCTTGRLHRYACLLLAIGAAVAVNRWLSKREAATLKFWKRSLPWIFAGFLLLTICIEGGGWLRERITTRNLPIASSGAPNVLVIVIDTLRADHMSSYGYPRSTSPNIDRIAKHGVLFENAIAPSSWTLPSHASLLTGREAIEHGMGNVKPMPWTGWGSKAMGGYPTLGEALQLRGYRTGAFSANRNYFTHNVGLGRGFMHFEDYFHSLADGFVRTQYGREVSRFYLNRSEKSKITRLLRYLHLEHLLDKDSEGSGDYGGIWGIRKRASDVNEETLRWIKQDRNRPFFAFLNYLDVHYSYGGPRDYRKPEWDHGGAIDEYDAGIRYVDDYIGRLVQELDRDGLASNTILVITSDHGESLGDHGLSYHGASLYWELVRVPLVITYPGHTPEGVRVSRPVANAALPATVLEILGYRNQQTFPGPALGVLWEKSPPLFKWPNPVSELPQTDTVVPQDRRMEGKISLSTTGSMESIATPRWHLILHETAGGQLYDWTRDPAESNNLANTQEGSAILRELKLQLEQRTGMGSGSRSVIQNTGTGGTPSRKTESPEPDR